MAPRMLRRRCSAVLGALVCVLAFGSAARAQCPRWLPGDGWARWSGLGIVTFTVLPDGVLAAGGAFTKAGGVTANRVACWNGVSWFALSTGMNDNVLSLTVLPNGDLVAGGWFTTAGGVAASGIARWDGTGWSALGSGTGGTYRRVQALTTLPGGDLVAGGEFTIAGGVAVNYIARWDGTAWYPLGSGVGGIDYPCVFALTRMPNGDIVAGGYFLAAGGIVVNRIARWDGAAWSALGTGMNGTVHALTTLPNGDLVAGGNFTVAGGVAANGIALWDGTAWYPLGSGVNPTVIAALTMLANGDLVAGGEFTIAGGVAANNIARWNGTAWSPLGSGTGGFSPGVGAVATLPNGDLVAGGHFNMAGGYTSVFFARCVFDDPPTVTTQPASVSTCRSGSALFSIVAAGTAPLAYSWRKDGTPIDPIANPSAATDTLTLSNLSAADAGSYDCIVSNTCGSATSEPATLTVCAADADCDGFVTGDDFQLFVEWFEFGDIRADFDGDGFLTGDDFEMYVTAFEIGC